MFQIVRASPSYCQITDGIIGTNYERLPYAYCTEAYAKVRAGRLSEESYENCGDDSFYVIEAGAPVRRPTFPRFDAVESFDDLPF